MHGCPMHLNKINIMEAPHEIAGHFSAIKYPGKILEQKMMPLMSKCNDLSILILNIKKFFLMSNWQCNCAPNLQSNLIANTTGATCAKKLIERPPNLQCNLQCNLARNLQSNYGNEAGAPLSGGTQFAI